MAKGLGDGEPLIPIGGQKRGGTGHGALLRDATRWTIFRNGCLIATWYFFSTTLSLLNKKLIGKKHGIYGNTPFPAPLLMTGVHIICQYLLAKGVFALGIVQRESKEQLSWREYAKTVLPNGTSTGLDIGFSNLSFQTITVSFYTMCKSTTPMFLLMFAFLMGLEKPSWRLAGVVAVISTGILLLVFGEAEFNLVGFLLVMTAACLAGLRWTLTQILLQGTKGGKSLSHGGPLDVLESLCPVMATSVLALSLLTENLEDLPASPYFHTFDHTVKSAAIMGGLGAVAFLMVWTEFKVIAETSALTFMVAGTLKEVVTVLAAVFFYDEHFGVINGVGLVVLLTGVSLYNFTKYQKLKQGEIKPARRGGHLNLKRDFSADALAATNPEGVPASAPGEVALSATYFRHKLGDERGEPTGEGPGAVEEGEGPQPDQ
eukprot:evm.model.scf_188.11 EVM.evm.TU.scf_188.11   scf_188:101557-108626(-)